jgi:hypothetical protein
MEMDNFTLMCIDMTTVLQIENITAHSAFLYTPDEHKYLHALCLQAYMYTTFPVIFYDYEMFTSWLEKENRDYKYFILVRIHFILSLMQPYNYVFLLYCFTTYFGHTGPSSVVLLAKTALL